MVFRFFVPPRFVGEWGKGWVCEHTDYKRRNNHHRRRNRYRDIVITEVQQHKGIEGENKQDKWPLNEALYKVNQVSSTLEKQKS